MVAIVLTLGMLVLPATSSAGVRTVGSNLFSAPNGGVCPTTAAGEASCSFVQEALADGHSAIGGVQPKRLGVITSWKILTGPATPATVGAKVRLRIIQAGGVSYAYSASPYEELPLGEPGVHVFPARLSISEAKQYVGIDVAVTGSGAGEAAAPFAYRAPGAGTVWKWAPGLSDGLLPQSTGEGNLELLVNAEVEPDRDRDGYGDETQDQCPEDRRRQEDCDRTPPRIKLTYARRQSFLATGKIVVYLRADEASRGFASGQVDIKGVAGYGINADRHYLQPGEKRKFVLRLPAKARESAARSFAHGRHVTATVRAYASDAARNFSETAVVRIKPKG